MQQCSQNPKSVFLHHSLDTNLSKRSVPFSLSVCPKASTLDIIFVLDGSGSVGSKNFDDVKYWVKEVSRDLHITDGITRIEVIQYSGYWSSE